LQEGKYANAEKYFKLGLEKRPKDTILRGNLGTFYLRRGLDMKQANLFVKLNIL